MSVDYYFDELDGSVIGVCETCAEDDTTLTFYKTGYDDLCCELCGYVNV